MGQQTASFYFNAHNGVVNHNSAWASPANAYNGDTTTYASFTAGSYNADYSNNYLELQGTTVDTSVRRIVSVQARIWGSNGGRIQGKMYDGATEIASLSTSPSSAPYGTWVALTPASGSWTVQKLQDLSVRLINTQPFLGQIKMVEIEVVHDNLIYEYPSSNRTTGYAINPNDIAGIEISGLDATITDARFNLNSSLSSGQMWAIVREGSFIRATSTAINLSVHSWSDITFTFPEGQQYELNPASTYKIMVTHNGGSSGLQLGVDTSGDSTEAVFAIGTNSTISGWDACVAVYGDEPIVGSNYNKELTEVVPLANPAVGTFKSVITYNKLLSEVLSPVDTLATHHDEAPVTVGSTTIGTTNFPNGYKYRKKFTIDGAKVTGSSNISNFVAYLNLTSDPDIDTSRLRIETTGGTLLDFEGEPDSSGRTGHYDHIWLRIPTLNGTSGYSFYVYWNTSGATSNLGYPTGVWTDWSGVYHFRLGSLNDYSGNNYHGSGSPITTPFYISPLNNGVEFNNDETKTISLPNTFHYTRPIVISAWFRKAFGSGYILTTDRKDTTVAGGVIVGVDANNNNVSGGTYDGVNGMNNSAGHNRATAPHTANSDWHKLDIRFNSYNSISIYVDGVLKTSTYDGTSSAVGYTATVATIGSFFAGVIAEFKISSSLTATNLGDRVATEYTNQSDVGNFYTVGVTEESHYATITDYTTARDHVYKQTVGKGLTDTITAAISISFYEGLHNFKSLLDSLHLTEIYEGGQDVKNFLEGIHLGVMRNALTMRSFAQSITTVDGISKQRGVSLTEVVSLILTYGRNIHRMFTEVIIPAAIRKLDMTTDFSEQISLDSLFSKQRNLYMYEVVSVMYLFRKGTTRLFNHSISVVQDYAYITHRQFTEVVSLYYNMAKQRNLYFYEGLSLLASRKRELQVRFNGVSQMWWREAKQVVSWLKKGKHNW